MTTIYSWTINSLPNYPQAEGQTDVVFVVNWTLTGVDGQYTASEQGSVGVTYVAGQPYTPYNQLTEEQVTGWVASSISEETLNIYKESIDRNIAQQKEIQILPLPW
jgi:hypothetical protein